MSGRGRWPRRSHSPRDHGGRRGVLDQQRGRDVHGRHCGEVAELGAGDGDDPVQQDARRLRTQQAPPATQRDRGERAEGERADRDAAEDDRAGRPAGCQQAGR
jgi:hypothetical protein